MILAPGQTHSHDGPDGKARFGRARVPAPVAVDPAPGDRGADRRGEHPRNTRSAGSETRPERSPARVWSGFGGDSLGRALARLQQTGTHPGRVVLSVQGPVPQADSGAERALKLESAVLAYRRRGASPPLYAQTPVVFRVRV